MMENLQVIKIGGNSIDDPESLRNFLADFSRITGPKILIHGGGKLATSLANRLEVPQTLVDGRRITNAETLDIAVMVYCGLINKKIVAALQANHCHAMGFCGADGNLVKSKKREDAHTDFGYVGDVVEGGVNARQFTELLSNNIVPVLSAITHDGAGNLLNTNADTMAAKIAVAMSASFHVSLVCCFEKNGVLLDPEDDESQMPALNPETYAELKEKGIISKGMIPKLDNAFEAAQRGVKTVVICHANSISNRTYPDHGTLIISK
jgi:acetylglutamate kinase